MLQMRNCTKGIEEATNHGRHANDSWPSCLVSLLCHGVVVIPGPHEETLWNRAKGIRIDLGVTCRGGRAFKLEDYVDVENGWERLCLCVYGV